MCEHEVPVPGAKSPRGNYGGATQVQAHMCVPLNSKRFMASSLRCIAHALDVPSTLPSDEIRTLVDGKLIELGNEPRNTQVWLKRDGAIELVSADGMFLQIEAEVDFSPLPKTPEDSDTNSL